MRTPQNARQLCPNPEQSPLCGQNTAAIRAGTRMVASLRLKLSLALVRAMQWDQSHLLYAIYQVRNLEFDSLVISS